MNSASAWVSYGSLVVATAAFLTSVATYRRSGPRIRAVIVRDWNSHGDLDVKLILYNRGLTSVDVVSVKLATRHMRGLVYGSEFTSQDIYEGPGLPYRLKGGSRQSWSFHVYEAMERDIETREFYWYKRRISMFIPFFSRTVFDVELGTGTELLKRPRWGLARRIDRTVIPIGDNESSSSDSGAG